MKKQLKESVPLVSQKLWTVRLIWKIQLWQILWNIGTVLSGQLRCSQQVIHIHTRTGDQWVGVLQQLLMSLVTSTEFTGFTVQTYMVKMFLHWTHQVDEIHFTGDQLSMRATKNSWKKPVSFLKSSTNGNRIESAPDSPGFMRVQPGKNLDGWLQVHDPVGEINFSLVIDQSIQTSALNQIRPIEWVLESSKNGTISMSWMENLATVLSGRSQGLGHRVLKRRNSHLGSTGRRHPRHANSFGPFIEA